MICIVRDIMSFIAILTILISILVAFYLGKRWLFWFDFKLTTYQIIFYWVIITLMLVIFILSKFWKDFPNYFAPLFSLILCSVYVTVTFDIIHLVSKKRFKPNFFMGYIFTGCVIVLFIIGYLMATHSQIIHYQVKIDKQANVDHMRIVQISDIHINELTQNSFIQRMVKDVNELNADIIVITGDTIDKRLQPFSDAKVSELFKKLKSKYGTYIIFGNHEYLAVNAQNNQGEDIIKAFKNANMTVLRDDIVYLNELGITLIGRDDYSSSKHGINRASLQDLLVFADDSSPIILLDHQPNNLEEPANLGVDLMLSGHTHGGQIFPINVLLKLLYKNSDGIYHNLEKHFTSIVSSGYGYGVMPLRLMTISEIVSIDVTFDNQKNQINN